MGPTIFRVKEQKKRWHLVKRYFFNVKSIYLPFQLSVQHEMSRSVSTIYTFIGLHNLQENEI